MLNKVAGGLLVLAILGYIAGVATGSAFIYVLCFLLLATSILFGLLVLAMNLIWKSLPEDFKRAYEGQRGRFNVIFLFCIVLFYIVAGVIGEICLPDASGLISALANTTTFVFVVFLGCSLIRRSKGKSIVAGGVVFILFIVLFLFVSSTALKSGGIAEANSIEKLTSLGYVDWVPAEKDIEKTGVTQHEPELAFEGLNLYCSQISPEAYLIDMHGNIVHKWSKRLEGCNSWKDHVEMYRNGDLLVVGREGMLIRLDWDSNVKWKKKMRVHHDACIDENENIYVLAKDYKLVFWHGIPVPILNDYIAVLSPSGKIQKKIYIYDLVRERITLRRLVKIYSGLLKVFKPKNAVRISILRTSKCINDMLSTPDGAFYSVDILHLNSVEIMDRDIEGFCKKGDLLISILQLNLVGVVDVKKEQIVWSWGPGKLDWQHHPMLMENGNVLVFDNGFHRGFTRVVELNPLTRKIVWEYKSKPPEEFFSNIRGGNHRLPNGNTLITDSEKGRVFEVTKEGKIVWEFYNPEVKKESKQRATIYRMMRVTDPEIYKLIER